MAYTVPRPVLVIAIGITILGACLLLGPTMQRAFFYPKPHRLPASVDESLNHLLARLQRVLEMHAPSVARSLEPGLSAAEIAALEKKGGITVSDDLRTLYRWHNGMKPGGSGELLAGQRFVPLEEAIRDRSLAAKDGVDGGIFDRTITALFVGHRVGWLAVVVDGAGDGYFFDPSRNQDGGSFFFNFAETRSYVWFPSVRNFVAGVCECYETGAVKLAADKKTIDEDYVRSQKIWERLGESTDTLDR
jgi:cell wall assembly regulator SMI1